MILQGPRSDHSALFLRATTKASSDSNSKDFGSALLDVEVRNDHQNARST